MHDRPGCDRRSTLAVSSFIVFFGIVAGAAVTMKVQYFLLMRSA